MLSSVKNIKETDELIIELKDGLVNTTVKSVKEKKE